MGGTPSNPFVSWQQALELVALPRWEFLGDLRASGESDPSWGGGNRGIEGIATGSSSAAAHLSLAVEHFPIGKRPPRLEGASAMAFWRGKGVNFTGTGAQVKSHRAGRGAAP